MKTTDITVAHQILSDQAARRSRALRHIFQTKRARSARRMERGLERDLLLTYNEAPEVRVDRFNVEA